MFNRWEFPATIAPKTTFTSLFTSLRRTTLKMSATNSPQPTISRNPIDPDETDADGNTIFHRAVLGNENLDDVVARAAELNVSADQPNNAGRTPLHVLASYDWYDDVFSVGSGYVAERVRDFLRHANFRNVDAADARGVRPLHLATMISEICVNELLAIGADTTVTTRQGLTPLHLATRARQSNVVGCLLDTIRDRGGTTATAAALSAVDEVGWQPLYYACRSGRPETVALLLQDGPSSSISDSTLPSLLAACAEFAQEQPLWESYHRPTPLDLDSRTLMGLPKGWKNDVVAGIDRLDLLRPWVTAGQLVLNATVAEITAVCEGDEGDEDADIAGDVEVIVNNNDQVRTDRDTTQLRPILQLLYEAHERDHAAGPQSFLQHLRAVSQKLATSPSSEPDAFQKYTSQCLCEFELELEREADGQQHNDDIDNDNDLSAVEERECGPYFKNLGPMFGGGDRIIRRLIRKRQFDQIPRLLLRWATPGLFLQENNLRDIRRGNCTVSQDWLSDGLRVAVELGQVDILSIALAKASARHPPLALLRETETTGTSWSDPLLYVACCRELPNMDVVRLLVETCHVDVNSRTMTIDERAKSCTKMLPQGTGEGDDPVPGHETALHALARGYHWWGTALAIPYLIEHGADVAITNEWGETALDTVEYGRQDIADRPQHKRVLELLRGGNSTVLFLL